MYPVFIGFKKRKLPFCRSCYCSFQRPFGCNPVLWQVWHVAILSGGSRIFEGGEGVADPTEWYRNRRRQNCLSDSFVPFPNYKLKLPQRGGWLATQSPPGSAPEFLADNKQIKIVTKHLDIWVHSRNVGITPLDTARAFSQVFKYPSNFCTSPILVSKEPKNNGSVLLKITLLLFWDLK